MNRPTIEQIESVLCRAYDQQAQKYEQALKIGEDLPESFARGADATDRLEQLRLALDEIARLSSRAEAARRQWETLGRRPSPRLREAVRRVEQPLKKLIEVVAAAEDRAREARDRLSPQLSRESRARQMRQAYASAIAASCELADE